MERQQISWRNGEIEISKSSMSGWSQTEIKTDMEIEEEFCAILESIKSEDERNVADIKPATLPEKLCAIPYDDMVDIFSSLETTEDILRKIEYSLSIRVKDTDTLPKQICRFCLEELEQCHRFRKTVAAAEKQLLAFEKLTSMKLKETEKNNALAPLYNAEGDSTEYDSFDAPSETNSDVENNTKLPIIPKAAECLRPCSVVLSILKIHSKDNSDAENGKRSPSDTEDRSADSTTEVFDFGRNESENNEESTSDSGVNTENPDDFALAHSGNQLLQCDVCAITFKWKSNLTRHYKMHTNEVLRSHKCKICAKTFKWISDLTRHYKMHTNKGPGSHKCKICAKPFKWKFNLTQHSKIHTGKGLHSCQYCEKSFNQPSKLKRHAASHSEERNYGCPLCHKSFKRSDDIRSHMKTVHLNNRLWRCAYCNKTFGHKSQLRRHLGACKLRSE